MASGLSSEAILEDLFSTLKKSRDSDDTEVDSNAERAATDEDEQEDGEIDEERTRKKKKKKKDKKHKHHKHRKQKKEKRKRHKSDDDNDRDQITSPSETRRIRRLSPDDRTRDRFTHRHHVDSNFKTGNFDGQERSRSNDRFSSRQYSHRQHDGPDRRDRGCAEDYRFRQDDWRHEMHVDSRHNGRKNGETDHRSHSRDRTSRRRGQDDSFWDTKWEAMELQKKVDHMVRVQLSYQHLRNFY